MSLAPSLTIDTLIIVCCHAIWLGGPSNGELESEWLIESFQTGEAPTFIKHIETGIQLLSANENAILVFSGGPTKQSQTQLSEAQSYHNLAIANNLFNQDDTNGHLSRRIFADNYATDSYQNILLSLIQFPIFLKSYQHTKTDMAFAQLKHVSIVSHDFKKARFLSLHLPALRWPTSKDVIWYGINPPFEQERVDQIVAGDRERGFGAWKLDLYGIGSLLANKRSDRGWNFEIFKKAVLDDFYGQSDRRLFERLLGWDGGATMREIFPEKLPWEEF